MARYDGAVNGAKTSNASRREAPRGRIDKRQAILEAAFRTFAREGYGQSCVREIAAEAGVAKPTIYNHLGDKETLFREAMLAAVGRTSGAGRRRSNSSGSLTVMCAPCWRKSATAF